MTNSVGYQGFDPKKTGETVWLSFDFAALTSAPINPVINSALHAGSMDLAPSGILSGAPVISGSKIFQKITGGIDGADYKLTCSVEVVAPDGSVFILIGILPVRNL